MPVLEYPSIPLCMASIAQKRNMQTILNKTVRFIHCNEREQLITEELHAKCNNITPSNTSNHLKAQNIWETIKISEPEQYEELTH